MADSE